MLFVMWLCCLLEEFEDTKWVIRIRISKKNRQHNGQKEKYKRTNNDLSIVVCTVNIMITVNWKKFEDTKGVIRICISKKNRLHNGQTKKYKWTNNDPQNIHIKLKIE